MPKIASKSFYMLEIWFPWSGAPRGNRWVTHDISEITSVIREYLGSPDTPSALCASYDGAMYDYTVILETYQQGVCLDRRDLRQYIRLRVPGFPEFSFDEHGRALDFDMKKEEKIYYKADPTERQRTLFGKLDRWIEVSEESLPTMVFPTSERGKDARLGERDDQSNDAIHVTFDWQSWQALPLFRLEGPFLQEGECVRIIRGNDHERFACLDERVDDSHFLGCYVYGEEFLD